MLSATKRTVFRCALAQKGGKRNRGGALREKEKSEEEQRERNECFSSLRRESR